MEVIAETRSGAVQGRAKEDVLLFAGIPYAAPPIGPRRFRAAQPFEPWSGVRDARKFGPAAPQIASGGMTDPAPVRWDEDCLTLNVQTPALDDSGRPVLVWIHGGGYRNGQGAVPWYNGARFAANGDIVAVTINYRLGALGFTDLKRFGAEFANSGINGILDQITALEWVRDNIEGFGGDPGKVTIAGESAGGFSVTTLLGSPRTDGLFRGVIAQSGAAHHVLPAEAGRLVADRFLDALGTDDVIGVEAASVEAVLAAQTEVSEALEGGPGIPGELGVPVSAFYPVVGSEVLPRPPLDAIRDGVHADVRVLAGSNHDETTLWGYGHVDEAGLRRTAKAFGAARLLDVYRETRPGASVEDLMIALTTDHMFRIPAIRLAEARTAGKTWLYQFNWRSRNERLGATHALEIPFAFDNLHQPGVRAFVGAGPSPQHVADAVHGTWTRFIRDGDPGFPAYSLARRETMVFDDASTVVADPQREERAGWDGVR
ncbi:MAG: carboxylesterase/lipase family protein [Gammaproteobacteria bacterium]|nr:carboxylesterase/lipase family protein [Gammaproteobacteria bacterium]